MISEISRIKDKTKLKFKEYVKVKEYSEFEKKIIQKMSEAIEKFG